MLPTDARALVRWYRLHRRALPWRCNPTPYRVWVSEIMLQQTQVSTVLQYYDRFLERFPDVRSLAAADESEVLQLWAGLGYYGRARNLRRAAGKVVTEFGGEFPNTPEKIMALPGIGRYTAGAILSIAFNQAYPAVDGNVVRVVSRLQAIGSPRPERYFRDQVAAWIPGSQASEFNQALMELGALVCAPVAPKCAACPLQAYCSARRLGIQDRIPPVRVKARGERVDLILLVVFRGDAVLLCSQPEGSFIPGDLGLPTRTLQQGEDAAELAAGFAREIVLGGHAKVTPKGRVAHAIVQRRITAHVYRVDGNARAASSHSKWLPLTDAASHLTSSLFRKALQAATDHAAP